MSYLARDVLNPRAFIYSSNADGLVIQTTTPDTRISFINSENNVEDLATVFYLSSSNNTFSVGNKNSNILTSIQSVNDEGFLNTGVVNPKKVLFQEDTNRQVVFKDYDVNSQFAGIGYTDGSMVVQLPSTSSKYEVKAASGALNTNLLNLVYDTGTQESRLGIGITNPQYALDVRGDIISSGTVIASNLQILGDTTIINTTTSNTDQVVVINDGTGPALQVTQIGAEPVATFYDDSYLAMIVADGGNVGIGTNNPRQTLEVVGNTIVSGKVGIGTLIPNKKLDIVGDIQITGQIFKNGTVFTDVYSEWLLNPDNSNLTTTVSGNLGVGTTEPTQKFEVIGNMKSEKIIADGSELTNLNAGNISFGTIDNNRLPADISVTSLTGDGSGLTALNATNISSGTLNNARLPSTITVTTVNADVTGDLTGNVSGSISGGSVSGEGSGLTALNATNISSGTLNNSRLPANISVTSLTGDGSGLTSLNATNISSGTLNNARLPSAISVTSIAADGSKLTNLNAGNISSGTIDNARLPSAISVTSLTGDGSGLTALNADNISSGTLNNSRLPTTVNIENLTATGNIGIGTASSTFPLYIHSDSALLTSKNGKIAIASGIGAIEPSTDLEIVNRSDNNTHSGILLRNRGNVYPTSSLRIRSTRFDNSTDSAYSASIGLARYNDNTYQKTNSPLGAIHFGGNHTNNSTDNIKYAASIQGIAEADFVSDSNVNIGLAFYTGSNAYQYIDTAASDKGIEQLRITSDGKVGIHTSTPNVSLEVIADDAILLPKGTTAYRPTGVAGYIRYNTETLQFEGFGAGNAWGSLGGVKSVSGDTFILAEYSPGNDDQGLHFYTNNQESMILTSNNHVGIGSTIPLVTIDTNATDAFKLPSGSNSDRPSGVAGYIRYNTETLQFEGYGAGDAWGSLGGVKSVAGDTYILAEYSPGNDDKALHFYTNGTEKMIIDSNGNVGIGTVTPLGLDVYKNSSIGEGLLGNYNSYSGGPFFKQQGWGSTGTTHTISYPDYCVNDNSSGTINIQIKSASGDKLGNVSISFLKKNSTDVDIFSIYYHKTANMTTLTVSPSTNDIQVSTDSDCAISWSSTGSC